MLCKNTTREDQNKKKNKNKTTITRYKRTFYSEIKTMQQSSWRRDKFVKINIHLFSDFTSGFVIKSKKHLVKNNRIIQYIFQMCYPAL